MGRFRLRRARLAASIFAFLLRNCDSGRLSFTARLLLHLRNAEQDSGEHLADRSVAIDLLRDAHHPQPPLAPVAEIARCRIDRIVGKTAAGASVLGGLFAIRRGTTQQDARLALRFAE